jgi:RNA polymerase sigma-70 factor (ECF subfamily)
MLDSTQLEIGKIYKAESGRVLAGLIRILGDLDLAEEALQEAFSVAMEKWPIEGIPKNPYSWLVSTGKFKAIDAIRRIGRGKELIAGIVSLEEEDLNGSAIEQVDWEKHLIEDDQLRLIFFCCHPLLPMDSRIALSLREVCGMSTLEIARAYLVPVETIKKRISRAKALIKEKKIPYEIPSKAELSDRVDAVLRVIYLVFNEGYSASSGEDHIRKDLSEEAIFLSRKLVELVSIPESLGLLALLLLQESRREARVAKTGDLIPLEDQDRSLWDQKLIREGVQLIQTAVMSGRLGPYTLQAAIASVHALADSVQNTQWELIVGYYDMLLSINPSPVVELNRAIAVGMHKGPKAGLAIIDRLMKNKKLNSYHVIYAAQADFCKKLRLIDKAIDAYQRAIELVRQEPEKRYLKKQLSEIL